MKCCLKIGSFNKNLLYILIGGLIRLFYIYFIDQTAFMKVYDDQELIYYFTNSLGLMLAIIPMIIYKVKNKEIKCCLTKKTTDNILDNKYELIYDEEQENIGNDKYKWILLSSVIDFSQTIIVNHFFSSIVVNTWIFDIIFISVFSRFIINIKLYLHHYISILFIVCVGVLLDILLDHYNLNEKNNLIGIFCKLIIEVILSLGFVIDKYIMEKKFCPPYEICFFHGLFNFIVCLIFLPFSTKINFGDYKEFLNNPSLDKFFAVITIMIFLFIYNIFALIINKNTTPSHILIMIIIANFSPYIKDSKKSTGFLIIVIIGLIIMLFFFFIFNEIIEIRCFGLDKNTKKNITIRAELERLSVKKVIDENDIDANSDEDNSVKDINDMEMKFFKMNE